MRPHHLAIAYLAVTLLTRAQASQAGEKLTPAKHPIEVRGKVVKAKDRPAPKARPKWIEAFEKALSAKVNVNFRDVPLPEAINFIQQVSDVGMLVEPEAGKIAGKKKITLKAERTEIRKVLDSILKIAGLQRCYRDRKLYISAKKVAKKPTTPPATGAKPATAAALEFVETPAAHVVNYVATKGKLNVVIDPKATRLLETRISFKAKGMKLRQILDWALRLSGTEKRMVDGVVYIRPGKREAKLEIKPPPRRRK